MNAQAKMPQTRDSITAKLMIGDLKMYVTVGLREDGAPGEIFIKADNVGTVERGLTHALALMVSTALQHGTPLTKVVEKLEGLAFEPAGLTGRSDIPMASSVVDLLAKWLKSRFLDA